MTRDRFRGSAFELGPIEQRELCELFKNEAGLMFGGDSSFVLERRLRERLLVLGKKSFREYIDYLKHHVDGPRELEEAIELVTTHETYFFREEYQLRAFRQEILPKLKQMEESQKRLHIWSAGCSTGEEAFTIAILILDSGMFPGWDIKVFGSDISRKCITAARRGVFGAAAFRALPDRIKATYFVETNEGFVINHTVSSLCTFGRINLLDSSRSAVIGHVNAIFCRNVLIYLDNDSRKKVIHSLYDRLVPGGYLMLGHSESLLHMPSSFEAVHLNDDLVYRKPEFFPSGNFRSRTHDRSSS
jgi:chemotaxis protein methyltransferase CheR